MQVKSMMAIGVLVLSSTAFAQRAEVYGDYSYMQFNPTISGVQSRAFNGGGGGFQFNLGPIFAVKGDFQGYGSTAWTINVTSPIPTPGGIIPVGTYTTKANMFTYMFGPVVRVPVSKLNVFGEVLFGGSNTSIYGNLARVGIVGGSTSYNPNQHPYTMAVGGGVDWKLSDHLAIRLGEFDWILTRYTNVFTNTNNQNSFRYLVGIVYRFGGM